MWVRLKCNCWLLLTFKKNRKQDVNITNRKHQPVTGVRLQVLNDVFGDRTDNNGLALSEVNQVGSDLSAVITRWVPANTQAGGWRVEWRWPRAAILVVFVFVRVQRRLVPLQLGLLQGVDAADCCRYRAGRLAQHRLTEGPHTGHVHSLQENNAHWSASNSYLWKEKHSNTTLYHKMELQCQHKRFDWPSHVWMNEKTDINLLAVIKAIVLLSTYLIQCFLCIHLFVPSCAHLYPAKIVGCRQESLHFMAERRAAVAHLHASLSSPPLQTKLCHWGTVTRRGLGETIREMPTARFSAQIENAVW